MTEVAIRLAFTGLVLLVAAQRLSELWTSTRNERVLRARGAREHAPQQMPFMRMLHAAWLSGMLAEVWLLDRVVSPWIAVPAFVLFGVGQALRISAMRALGDRWNVKILTLPGRERVDGGIFRYLRHPNYLGVVLEIAALPLIGGAVVTAVVMSIANAVLLMFRIRAEERALVWDSFPRLTRRALVAAETRRERAR